MYRQPIQYLGTQWAATTVLFGSTPNGDIEKVLDKVVLRSFSNAIVTEPAGPQTALRNFTHGVVTELQSNLITIKNYSQAVITDVAAHRTLVRNFTHGIITTLVPNVVDAVYADHSSLFGQLSDITSFKTFAKAAVFTGPTNNAKVTSNTRMQVSAVGNNTLYARSTFQSIIYNPQPHSVFLGQSTRASINTASTNFLFLNQKLMRASLLSPDIYNRTAEGYVRWRRVRLNESSTGSVFGDVNNKITSKSLNIANAFAIIPNRVFSRSTFQSVIFDTLSNTVTVKTFELANSIGQIADSIRQHVEARASLQRPLVEDSVSNTGDARGQVPESAIQPGGARTPDGYSRWHRPRLNESSVAAQYSVPNGLITTRSAFQSIIYEIAASDAFLLSTSKALAAGQTTNTTKLQAATRAVLWLSNRAYGRRRWTYFA